jgi:uncharacterized spore protein YtfJ
MILKREEKKMFNLVKDDFDENSDDILNSINKMLEKNKKEKEEEKKEKKK